MSGWSQCGMRMFFLVVRPFNRIHFLGTMCLTMDPLCLHFRVCLSYVLRPRICYQSSDCPAWTEDATWGESQLFVDQRGKASDACMRVSWSSVKMRQDPGRRLFLKAPFLLVGGPRFHLQLASYVAQGYRGPRVRPQHLQLKVFRRKAPWKTIPWRGLESCCYPSWADNVDLSKPGQTQVFLTHSHLTVRRFNALRW